MTTAGSSPRSTSPVSSLAAALRSGLSGLSVAIAVVVMGAGGSVRETWEGVPLAAVWPSVQQHGLLAIVVGALMGALTYWLMTTPRGPKDGARFVRATVYSVSLFAWWSSALLIARARWPAWPGVPAFLQTNQHPRGDDDIWFMIPGLLLVAGGGLWILLTGAQLMAHGGTPDPLDPPTRRVVDGAYAKLHHPMQRGQLAFIWGTAFMLWCPGVVVVTAVVSFFLLFPMRWLEALVGPAARPDGESVEHDPGDDVAIR